MFGETMRAAVDCALEKRLFLFAGAQTVRILRGTAAGRGGRAPAHAGQPPSDGASI